MSDSALAAVHFGFSLEFKRRRRIIKPAKAIMEKWFVEKGDGKQQNQLGDLEQNSSWQLETFKTFKGNEHLT